jgi:hypothetical protein
VAEERKEAARLTLSRRSGARLSHRGGAPNLGGNESFKEWCRDTMGETMERRTDKSRPKPSIILSERCDECH